MKKVILFLIDINICIALIILFYPFILLAIINKLNHNNYINYISIVIYRCLKGTLIYIILYIVYIMCTSQVYI